MIFGNYFIKGIIIGIIFGIPAGVVGILTIKRSITYGAKAGFISGIGCSIADLIYSCVSIFSITLISDFLLKYQNIINSIGGTFVILMGIGIMRKKQGIVYEKATTVKIISFFTSSFLITITNPATILSFLLAFSIFNVKDIDSGFQGIELAVGIFGGSCVWWILITIFVQTFRKCITDIWIKRINYVLGIFIILFGIFIII
ncbi:MAG: LysE family transporter [Clostridiales bacterium]|jgi:threonine/homoserine/homoserine lactone efflux protein|nr:LysE family transporter [Clostridiales bacterium]